MSSTAELPPLKNTIRVAYGAGGALAGLIAEATVKFDWIVDDTPGYAGHKFAGCPIRCSEALLTLPPGSAYIVVCAQTSTASKAMAGRLEKMGFRRGVSFCDSADLAVPRMSRRMAGLLGKPFNEPPLDRVRLAVEGVSLRNLSGIAGTWLFVALVEALSREGIAGSVAEAGVYQGANAIASLRCSSALRERPYYLLDSFKGLGKASSCDPDSRGGEFSDVNPQGLRAALASYGNAHICSGLFDRTLPQLPAQRFALAYVDCDLSEPAEFCLNWFWERLADGGFLLIHDYWFPDFEMPAAAPEPFRGIKSVADRFIAVEGAQYVVHPETTHLVVRKERKL
jgi:hypothetical protein